uniref:Uncharacterized protein n=1 Tax=Nelumbo nucifera TaxID=4432 RepID=A0A822YNL6_NELNU|nr:TPA_asm: hypothetical protein HUJ06_009729 [Nelumbo nucifera]
MKDGSLNHTLVDKNFSQWKFGPPGRDFLFFLQNNR